MAGQGDLIHPANFHYARNVVEGGGGGLGSNGGVNKQVHAALLPPGIYLLRRA